MGKTYKHNDILDLATYMANSHYGVTLEDIIEKYEISRRTAERRRDEVFALFPDYEVIILPNDRKKRYKLNHSALREL